MLGTLIHIFFTRRAAEASRANTAERAGQILADSTTAEAGALGAFVHILAAGSMWRCLVSSGTHTQETAWLVLAAPAVTRRRHALALVHIQALCSPWASLEACATHAAKAAWCVLAASRSTGHRHAATFIYIYAASAMGVESETRVARTRVATGPGNAASGTTNLGIALAHAGGGT